VIIRGNKKIFSFSLTLSLLAILFIACDQSAPSDVQSGQVLYRANYLPFGGTLPLAETAADKELDYTFASYEKDDALSSLDAVARSFDPMLDRFSQVDPVDPRGVSAYTYAANNPLTGC